MLPCLVYPDSCYPRVEQGRIYQGVYITHTSAFQYHTRRNITHPGIETILYPSSQLAVHYLSQYRTLNTIYTYHTKHTLANYRYCYCYYYCYSYCCCCYCYCCCYSYCYCYYYYKLLCRYCYCCCYCYCYCY